ncbi:hypothetical protein ACIGHJ_07980 [Stutzerimonas kunmingensis]|uniref:COG3904 family protein n=1 Tax=Stutzerimonas stutzeri subgroup TaxID=578833 RepID=UPI001C48568E|nr:hypothetical protein [Stutzerimonas stutzeri]
MSITSFMGRFRVAVTLLLVSLTCLSMARAAEISSPESGGSRRPLSGILIEGPIVKGDFEKFEYLALGSDRDPVWLASPGGDLFEAMRIGALVRRMKLSVQAPDANQKAWSVMIHVNDPRNNVCASACFFIYAAGVERFGDTLGIHRPRITEEDLRNISMDQAASGLLSANEVASAYLRKMGIPHSIIERMNSTKPRDIQWLGEEDVESLSGYIPEYQDWLDAKCPWGINVPDAPKRCEDCSLDELVSRWSERADAENFECKTALMDTEREAARHEILDEYVKTGRLKEMVEEQRARDANRKEPKGTGAKG